MTSPSLRLFLTLRILAAHVARLSAPCSSRNSGAAEIRESAWYFIVVVGGHPFAGQ